ncbi:MAG: hypothetical protein K1Y36_30965 [Blastocatellia bacterium]|nr:hypothetical protein [Blastocatellia bacterium]
MDTPELFQPESLNPWLVDVLQAHHLSATTYRDWVLVNGTYPAMAATVVRSISHEQGVTLQIDVVFLLPGGVRMVESVAGLGENHTAAIRNGLDLFCANSLHVCLAAFWNCVDEQQVLLETWSIGGNVWQAYIGNYGIRSFGLDSALEIPEGLLGLVQRLLHEEPLAGEVVWLRLSFFHQDAEEQSAEVLLHNEPWPAAEKAILNLDWPRRSGFYSVRLFLILNKLNGRS